MTVRKLTVPFRRLVHHNRLIQLALVFGFWLAGEAIASRAGLPVPGSIVGLALVLLLLLSRRLSLFSLRRGADMLLAEMLLFFVPAVLAVLAHPEFLGLLGLKVLAVILVGTVAVMAVTAFTVDLCYRWNARHAHV